MRRLPRVPQLKAERKAAGKHIEIKDLPPSDRFTALRSEKKHFIDTIKLIAYRAETTMAGPVREHLRRHDDARSLLRQLYCTAVDLQPDQAPKRPSRCACTISARKFTRRTPRNRLSRQPFTPDFPVRRLVLTRSGKNRATLFGEPLINELFG